MRRIQLAALVGTAILFSPASALAGHAHHKKPAKKPTAVKNGTYNAKYTSNSEKFTITLTGAKVSLPASTHIECDAPPLGESGNLVEGFVTPVALPASGSLTEHAPISVPGVPGAPPLTGQSTFSITFTKKGTASGYLEESYAGTIGDAQISCASGKEPFTAKLG
jgi:hypothetical protein